MNFSETCENLPPTQQWVRDTGLKAKYVEQFLLPILADVPDLHSANFDEDHPAWKTFLLFVEFENSFAARLLRGHHINSSEFTRFLQSFAFNQEPENLEYNVFFQQVFPFLVRFPGCMLAANPPRFSQRLREMTLAQFFAELLRAGFPLGRNVRFIPEQQIVLVEYCPQEKPRLQDMQTVRMLLTLGIQVKCASFGPTPPLSSELRAFRDHYLRAWEFRDWTTLVQLLQSIGIIFQ